ncbi:MULTISPECIES: MarR family transcriptional regulator [unclassified Streptomyces]|uniref:MarR family winged helix-turn-helix transcriptional regulator n=1 Tax=unclassified Streptomyces TaxID=2593676 RepID=UPI002DD9AD02|nr:MarR family transcriptional regulator [Streptomyces sp. NBC_01768]WSC32952.1 MarR family transcriptional regulator [Streptomyces sp. NBC_01768]
MTKEDGTKQGVAAETRQSPKDAVDQILDQWRRERPDLDLSAVGVFGRLGQLSLLLTPILEGVFAQHGLRRGEFDVLAALRRSGPPYTLIPSALAKTLMLSRAGMTNRLDRLEADGLVERRLDPTDRRSFRVALTDRGHEVVDAAVTDHAANESRLLSALTPDERETLDHALRTLLQAIE